MILCCSTPEMSIFYLIELVHLFVLFWSSPLDNKLQTDWVAEGRLEQTTYRVRYRAPKYDSGVLIGRWGLCLSERYIVSYRYSYSAVQKYNHFFFFFYFGELLVGYIQSMWLWVNKSINKQGDSINWFGNNNGINRKSVSTNGKIFPTIKEGETMRKKSR